MRRPQQPPAAAATARDIMNRNVVSAPTTATVRTVAQLLREHEIGAVPVLDESGAPVGMVSDGDLLGRRAGPERREWWLDLLADDTPAPEPSGRMRNRPIQEVMSTPLISIDPHTAMRAIAALLQAHRIKRVPVLDDGKLVGIVSRADLLAAVEHLPESAAKAARPGGGLLSLIAALAGGMHHASPAEMLTGAEPEHHSAPTTDRSAEEFRALVEAAKQEHVDEAAKARQAAQLERQRQVKAILEQHVSAEFWQQLLAHAELAARHGENEFLLLRFPSSLCSDGGRKIDVGEAGWPATLRGEAAELYAKWERELKPKGFGIAAKILSFEHGLIGDFGLYLTWGERR